MPTFDGENLLIILDAGVTNIDWMGIYSDWKDWMLESPEHRKYPEAFRTTGGDPLNMFLDSGAYWFLRNDYGWRIKPPEEDITILASGNLAPEDALIDMFAPTDGGYTVAILGLQPVTQGFSYQLATGLERSFFGNMVTVDLVNGVSGTGKDENGYPIGTPRTPSNNVQDALVIADMQGFKNIYFVSDVSLGVTAVFDNFFISGQSSSVTTIIITESASVQNTIISDCMIEGRLDGGNTLYGCVIGDITYVTGQVRDSYFNGTITLSGSGDAPFANCRQYRMDTTPVINMGGFGKNLVMTNYTGIVNIINFNDATGMIGIGLDGGIIRLDSASVANGLVHVSGTGRLTDELGNLIHSGTWNGEVTVINELIDTELIVDSVWDEDLSGHLVAGTTGKALDDASVTVDVDTIADAVWDEPVSDHLGGDKAGQYAYDGADYPTQYEIADIVWEEPIADHRDVAGSTAEAVSRVLGLSQENFRISDHVYEGTSLVSATVKIYPTAGDCNNDTNALAIFTMTAQYDEDGRLNSYKVVEA